MVATLGELRAARALLDEERAALGDRPRRSRSGSWSRSRPPRWPPSASPREVDFFSIGTNDLAQYTIAAERGNEHVADLADAAPCRPCWRSSPRSSAAPRRTGAGSACAASWPAIPLAAVLLVGLGVTELSMAAPRIPDVKEALRGIDAREAAAVAREAIAADDARAASALAADLVGSASRATIPPS